MLSNGREVLLCSVSKFRNEQAWIDEYILTLQNIFVHSKAKNLQPGDSTCLITFVLTLYCR